MREFTRNGVFWLALISSSVSLADYGVLPVQAQGDLRADVAQYIDFLQNEQEELDFQVARAEITVVDYQRASDRIAILRSLMVAYGRSGQPGGLPEYHVVTATELDTLIPEGQKKLLRGRTAQIIDGKWRFVKTVTRKQRYYVLERLVDSF
jgi:hypothetical protein